MGEFLTAAIEAYGHREARWSTLAGVGVSHRMARLSCWRPLARRLSPESDVAGPNGDVLDMTAEEYCRLRNRSAAMAFLQGLGPQPAEAMPEVVSRLHGILAEGSPASGPILNGHPHNRLPHWAETFTSPPPMGKSHVVVAALGLLEFVRLSPLPCRNIEVAALLAAHVPVWNDGPVVALCQEEHWSSDAFTRALAEGLDGDLERWVTYYVRAADSATRTLTTLAEAALLIERRLAALFRRLDMPPRRTAELAAHLLANPVITHRFMEEMRVTPRQFEDMLILMFAAGEALEVAVPGHGFTVATGPLRLLI